MIYRKKTKKDNKNMDTTEKVDLTINLTLPYDKLQRIQNSYQKLANFSCEKFITDNIPSVIYHYTSPEGLLGILQKDSIHLRYTKYDCLNDKTERKNIQEILAQLIAELKESKSYEDSFLSVLSNVKITDTFYKEAKDCNGNKIVGEFHDEKYLCCFCEDDNILGMWRYYVKNTASKGYCIGLSTDSFPKFDKNLENSLNCKRIIYSDQTKKEILTEIISLLYEQKEIPWNMNEIFNDYLSDIDMYFKNQCFSDEKEIRSIIAKEEFPEIREKIEFKNSNGNFIPYIELKYPKEMLKAITLSPLMENDDERNLRYMLEYLGYKNLEIKYSDLPIRF